jgi:arylsulfatase A-like enzyme
MEVLRHVGYKSLVVTDSVFVQPLCKQADDLVYVTPDQARGMVRSKQFMTLVELLGSAIYHKSTLSIRSFAPNFLKNKLTERWIVEKSSEDPWFVMVHYDVHWPYQPPTTFRKRFVKKPLEAEIEEVRRDVYELIASPDLAKKIGVIEALYDAQIAWVDACIGNLLSQMSTTDILDNTLVIVTSDHGDLLGEHGLLHHEFVLYEPLIRVPFIVRFPDRSYEGTRSDALVQTVDILPTLFDYLRINQPTSLREMQGKSLIKILDNSDRREFTISERADWSSATSRRKLDKLQAEYPNFDWKKYAHEIVALRTKDYKYIWSSDNRDELFDLSSDQNESSNLVSLRPEKANELKAKLDSWRSSYVHAPIGEDQEFETSITKRLRALGYM